MSSDSKEEASMRLIEKMTRNKMMSMTAENKETSKEEANRVFSRGKKEEKN